MNLYDSDIIARAMSKTIVPPSSGASGAISNTRDTRGDETSPPVVSAVPFSGGVYIHSLPLASASEAEAPSSSEESSEDGPGGGGGRYAPPLSSRMGDAPGHVARYASVCVSFVHCCVCFLALRRLSFSIVFCVIWDIFYGVYVDEEARRRARSIGLLRELLFSLILIRFSLLSILFLILILFMLLIHV